MEKRLHKARRRPRCPRARVLRGRWLHAHQDAGGCQCASVVQRCAEREAQLQRPGSARRPRRDRRRREIMSLLVNDWGFAVDKSELNPNDPLVNTASEYMYQMATISYHTLHGATTVTFPEDVTASTARSSRRRHLRLPERWQLLDRLRPDQPDRGCGPRQALDRHGPCAHRRARRRQRHRLGPPDGPWDGGDLRHLIGATVLLTGLGLVWASRPATEKVKAPAFKQVADPSLTTSMGPTTRIGSETARANSPAVS